MMLVKTYVSLSSIEGLGVYAAEPIAEGEEVWRFNPEFDRLISVAFMQSAHQQIREYLERYTYPYHFDNNYRVLDSDDSRYMNHADIPNIAFPDHNLGVAARAIAAGEELTCDYSGFMDQVVLYPSRQIEPVRLVGARTRRRMVAGAR